jgi:hypothetical protein
VHLPNIRIEMMDQLQQDRNRLVWFVELLDRIVAVDVQGLLRVVVGEITVEALVVH